MKVCCNRYLLPVFKPKFYQPIQLSITVEDFFCELPNLFFSRFFSSYKNSQKHLEWIGFVLTNFEIADFKKEKFAHNI